MYKANNTKIEPVWNLGQGFRKKYKEVEKWLQNSFHPKNNNLSNNPWKLKIMATWGSVPLSFFLLWQMQNIWVFRNNRIFQFQTSIERKEKYLTCIYPFNHWRGSSKHVLEGCNGKLRPKAVAENKIHVTPFFLTSLNRLHLIFC